MREGIDCKGRKWVERELKGTAKDITGQTYESLTALLPVYRKDTTAWLCQCQCGNQLIIDVHNWQKTKSCGCSKAKATQKRYDSLRQEMIGQVFTYLTVKDYTIHDQKAYYECECKCGNTIWATRTQLISGQIKSCGCRKSEILADQERFPNKSLTDLTGQQFGYWTVLGKNEEDHRYNKTHWWCQCKCGNKASIATGSLIGGHTHSCGCYQKERMTEIKKADLLGQRFGFITVIDSAPSRAGGQAYWKCQCDCGTIWEVAANNLLSGKTQSCGCILSLGEQYISQILKENHIHFRTQQTFSDLVSDTNTALRYDFAILNEEERPIRLIEFDGPQHQQSSEYFGGEDAFHRLQKHDALKNQYAFDHNIPLIRIPYKERDNITLELLLGDKYLLTKT